MKLFTYFASSGYHTSVVSTFSLDLEAYEAIALPRLRDAGCNNNVVVADARMLAQALGDAARRPRFAGRRYCVVGALSVGVFHPKLILQLGKASGRLLVGSANMTAAGLAGNFEVIGEVTVTEGDTLAAPLLRAAVDYLLRFMEPGSVARRQVEWALKRSRWLPAKSSTEAMVALQDGLRVAFLARDDTRGIAKRFVEFIGERVVQRLVVASPYWDHDLSTLSALQRTLGAAKVAVLIQPRAALYPVDAHSNSDTFELFDVNLVPGAAGRFSHAKLIIAETDSDDCVLFGSANCTQAALGIENQPGINEEVCVVRDMPAGQAVRVLELEAALHPGKKLAKSEVPNFTRIDDIPLSELEARLPGRFELSGDLLRWWPPAAFAPGTATIQLLDHIGEPVTGELTRVGALASPATYLFNGTVAPHFALVRQGEFDSSLAVVVIEQAIQKNQRRSASRGVENALELLDDDEASEGLWLLEVIQRLTEAEHEMRGSRGTPGELPQQEPAADATHDSHVLSYSEFVAGRRGEDGATASSCSHLAATYHESVRSFLNALIGRRAVLDVTEAPEGDGREPDLDMGDETSDGAGAVESGDLEASSSGGPIADLSDHSKRRLQQRKRSVQDTQSGIVNGVEAFLTSVREHANAQPLGVVDLLRLRALLVVVLGAGSKKANLQSKDLNAKLRRRQVLPPRGDASWRRLVERLLFEFFRDHGGTRRPLIESLRLAADDGHGFPVDVLECWATCFWAICARRMATDDAGVAFELSTWETQLAVDLYRFCRVLPQQACCAVVGDVFAGMNRRYAEQLGVSAERVEQEHQALVVAALSCSNSVQA